MQRIFTGAQFVCGSACWPPAIRTQSFLLVVIGLICSGGPIRAVAELPPQYGFEEGEPLFYRMDVAITNAVAVETHFYDGSDQSRHDSQVNFRFDYQLMPILQKPDGAWKVRIVLDKLEEALNRDGDVKQRTLDRDQLGMSHIHQVNLSAPEIRGEAVSTSSIAGTVRSPTSAAEDLFADPIVASIKPDGTIKQFEDRTELRQVMPGFDLKECLELALPPLLVPALKQGATWTREVPVDLPEPPLPGHQADSLRLALQYTVKGIEAAAGKRTARIHVQGHAVFDGLSIPIRQEEIKYLIWTTRVLKIEDTLEGEYLFDLDSKAISFATVSSLYRFSTLATRKEDKQRGKVFSDNVVRTRIVNRQTNPMSSDARQPGRTSSAQDNAPAITPPATLSAVPK